MPRILVADDTAAIRTSLRRALELEGYEVELVCGGRDALRAIAAQPPAAVVLDRVMPDLDGVEVCRRLRAAGDHTPVLMLTVRTGIADRVAGLDGGADDYLTKPFALDELLARVRALIRRGGDRPAPVAIRFGDMVIDAGTREVRRGDRLVELTPTEWDLLAYLAGNARTVLDREQILEEVWGYPSDTSSNTLEVYIGYLRRKLEAGGEPRLIHTVRGVGYVMRHP